MFKLIKWVFILAVLAVVALWYTGYKVRGKTIQEHLQPYKDSKMVKEGLRDIRSLLGESLKAAGEAITEDVTDAERKQLDDVLKKELKMGKPIDGAPGQQALPPTPQAGAVKEVRPDLTKQIDQLKALQSEKK